MSNKYPGGLVTLNPPVQDPALGAATPGIWTLDQALNAEVTRSWPMYDPYYKNVVLNLHGEGTNGAQNNTFLDSSSNAFTITRNGNTTQGSFSPYGNGWGVFLTSGTDLALYMNSQTQFVFGTGDFNFELWVNLIPTGTSANQVILDWRPGATNGAYPTLYLNSTSGKLAYYANTGDRIVADTTFAYNTWTHVAVSRASGTTRMFINGVVQSTTYSDSTNYTIGATNRPATSNGAATNEHMYGGMISNLRIIKGQAIYTSSFSVPTSPLTTTSQGAIAANVSLLTAQSNRFVDNSPNAFTVNSVGVIGTTKYQPFLFNTSYTPSTIGGSGYFDGSGDYLTIADNAAFALGTNNFTIEAWVYPMSAFANYTTIIAQSNNGSVSSQAFDILVNSSGAVLVEIYIGSSAYTITSATSLVLNAWSHVALVRSGSTFTLYINGASTGTPISNAGSVNDSAVDVTVGSEAGGFRYWNGYICDARIVNGTAIVPSTGGPTSPLTAVTNTKLLCNMTNAGIYDNAMMNDLETVGNAQISTSVKKYGTGSMYFDGTGDGLLCKQFNQSFGGDFTFEFWIYRTGTSVEYPIDTYMVASGNQAVSMYINSGGAGAYNAVFNGGTRFTGPAGSLPANTWTHVAMVRANGVHSVYINGIANPSTYTTTTAYNNCQLAIGRDVGNFYSFTGYLDDVRITNGVARYVANFTPPTSQLQDQ